MSGSPGVDVGSVRIGLQFAAAMQAMELAASGLSRREVAEELTAAVAASEESRKRRIAGVVARRFVADGETEPPLRVVARAAGSSLDTRHLLLYTIAGLEPLVVSIAEEIFYDRFVLGRTPGALSESEWATLNTGQLLETDEVITHRLVDHYAQTQWGLDDPTSTQCALRILREGGALGATWLARGGTRCLGYFPTHRGPSWRVFAYALWDEFASHGRREVPRAHLRSMRLARLFSLRGPVLDVMAERAASEGFGIIDRRRSGGRLIVTHKSFDEAAQALAGAYTLCED